MEGNRYLSATNRDRRAAVVVIGAGITGAFAGYFLAQLGAEVKIIERGQIGGQASGRNPGGLNPLHGPGIPSPLLDLALASFRIHLDHWDRIRTLTGAAFNGRIVSRIHIALDDSDMASLRGIAALHEQQQGFEARWLTSTEMSNVLPEVTDAAVGGLWTNGSATVDAQSYTAAVVAAAVRAGAQLIHGEVTNVETRGHRISGAVVDGRVHRCDAAVLAPGPWWQTMSHWFAVDVGVRPVKGDLLLAEPPSGAPVSDLSWKHLGIYAVNERRVWLGGTEEDVGFDPTPSEASRDAILAGIATLLPAWTPGRVVDHVAGLRPTTTDGLPLVGKLEPWENVYLAGGGGRKGMLFAPALGLAAAQLSTAGSTQLPVGPCRPDRPGLAA